MSKDYNHEIGYESLVKDWKVYKKQVPRGVTLAKGGNSIYLQFKTPNTSRSKYKCNCTFSIDGMIDAVRKAHKVAEKLKSLTSEVEFWSWYEKEIKQESQLADDQLTFREAIAKVEDDFWSRPSRTKRKREKLNHSDRSSWHRTYGCFYKHLPEQKTVNLGDIQKIIDEQVRGTRNYKYVVSAMKKLARVIKRQDVLEALEDINITQTENAVLQAVKLEDFMNWRAKVLGVDSPLSARTDLPARKAWLWAFSMQVIYALRISEVFAIKNLTEPYITKDGVSIPALNDPSNTTNLIYIGDKTVLGTTVKTGSRVARPLIPPKYPDLMEKLNIKQCLIPANKPISSNSDSIRRFFSLTGRQKLILWNAPFSQTHALRHLANINGMQAGIPLEIRAQSMGHTPAMNDGTYKKRQSTQTTIDLLLNSNQNAIDFVTALAEAKKLIKEDESNREVIVRLLSVIYQKDSKALTELL